MMRGRFPEKMRIDLSVEDKRKLAELATERGVPMAGCPPARMSRITSRMRSSSPSCRKWPDASASA